VTLAYGDLSNPDSKLLFIQVILSQEEILMQANFRPTWLQSGLALLECYNSVPQDPLFVHFKKNPTAS